MNLTGAKIIVTGAAAGLGLAIVEDLLAAGARPILVDRDVETLRQVCAKFQLPGYTADLTQPEEVASAVERILGEEGVPQGLVNNAGAIRNMPLLNVLAREGRQHSLEMWQETMNANLYSVFLMTRAIVDHMVQKRVRGVVVNMSSVSARGNAGQGAYAAAKAGVEALTRVWANELGPLGLRFVAVAPGFIDTPSTRAALSETALEEWRQHAALRRLGAPTHVAQAVRYAFENDMLTGTVLAVDGGLML